MSLKFANGSHKATTECGPSNIPKACTQKAHTLCLKGLIGGHGPSMASHTLFWPHLALLVYTHPLEQTKPKTTNYRNSRARAPEHLPPGCLPQRRVRWVVAASP